MSASWPTTASCSASRRSRARTSSSCATSAASRWSSSRTSPASWSVGSTRTGHRPRRRQAGHRGRVQRRPQVHRRHRRLVRRRQLRHVRSRLRPALPLDVAERPDLGDGRGAGRLGAGDGAARRPRGARARTGRRRTRRRSRIADPRAVRAPGLAVLLHRPALGRRHHRPGRHPTGARHGPRGRGRHPRSRRRRTASSGCERHGTRGAGLRARSPTAARSRCG